jgi:hypothetical protein
MNEESAQVERYATPMPPSLFNGPSYDNVKSDSESVHQRLQRKKASLEIELNKVNLALSSLDANPHFANIMATVERALGRL